MILLFLTALPAFAETPPPDAAEYLSFFQRICPEGKILKKGGVPIGCECCPKTAVSAGECGQEYEIVASVRGSFTSPAANEAVVTMLGCLPHSLHFGANYVLRFENGVWKPARYNQGLLAEKCEKWKLSDGRDALLCRASDGHQGYFEHFIYLMRFDPSGGAAVQRVFQTDDSVNWCSGVDDDIKKVIQSEIRNVEYPDLDGDGSRDLRIRVSLGSIIPTKAQLDACQSANPGADLQRIFGIKPRTYTLEFLFRDDQFTPTEATRTLLHRFPKPRQP
jgi:hypothetical protein